MGYQHTSPIKRAPIITVGKYAGTPIDKLPNSYLRWMLTQDFPREWIEAARCKVEKSDFDNTHLALSRHAVDTFSKRFISRWLEEEASKGNEGRGLATFITHMAEKAWEEGRDVSKHRHQNDGIVKLYEGIQFVFAVNPNFPEYKEVITVYEYTSNT